MDIFVPITDIKINPNKKNIAILDKIPDGEFTHIYGAGKLIKEKLQKDFNVFTFWLNTIPKNIKEPNQFKFNYTSVEYSLQFLRKKDDPENYLDKNLKLFKEVMNCIDDLPSFEFLFILSNTTLTMPLTSYCAKSFDEKLCKHKSEYFDYIDDDQNFIDKINKINENLFSDDKTFIRRFTPYAISTKVFSNIFYFFKNLYIKGKVPKFISLVTDPNLARNYFQYNKIPFDFYYFVEDQRGTREYKKLGINQLQHIYAERTCGESNYEKDKNVFFAGSIFHEKGPRFQIWQEFLKDFNYPNSSYFIPIKKNGIVKRKETTLQQKVVKERFSDTFNEVKNHPLMDRFLPPIELERELKRYKIGLVFRCVSVYDSLTSKPYQYITNDVLPLFDWKYDLGELDIPVEIKEKLTIRNSTDIKRLTDFYINNEDERQKIIEKLKLAYDYDFYENHTEAAIERDYQIILKNAGVKYE